MKPKEFLGKYRFLDKQHRHILKELKSILPELKKLSIEAKKLYAADVETDNELYDKKWVCCGDTLEDFKKGYWEHYPKRGGVTKVRMWNLEVMSNLYEHIKEVFE